MSHSATDPTAPARHRDGWSSAAIEHALTAIGAQVSLPAAVGILSGSSPDRAHSAPALDPSVIDAIHASVAIAPDGWVASAPIDRDGDWVGYRYGVGGGRSVYAIVAAPRMDPLAEARLQSIALALARDVLIDEQRRRSDQLDQLLATARRVAESLELDTVLSSIVEDATTLLGADSGDMLLWDRDQDRLRVVAVANFAPEMLGFELAFGEGMSSQAILGKRTIETAAYGTYAHRAKALDRYDFGAVLCAPLLFRGEAIGALNVHARVGQSGFAPGAADLLAAFAGHAAIAIDHARRYENEVRLGRVLSETNRELTRLLTVQQELAEQVLLGAGAAGIADVLAQHLGRRVLIQDHLRRLIAGAAPDGSQDWRRLIDEVERSDARVGGVRDPFNIAVRVGRRVVGHLVLSSDDDLGPIDRALVDIATTGVALEFAKEHAAAEVEERLRGEAITDLLTGAYASEEAIGVRAARLGYDLGDPRDLMVIDVIASDGASDPAPVSDHDHLLRQVHRTRERLGSRAPRSVAIQHAGLIAVLVPAGRQAAADLRALAEDLKICLESADGSDLVTIALGDRCERPSDYAPALRLARESVQLMLKLGRQGTIIDASELGPYGLLLRASSREELESFALRTLDPLVEHDRLHGSELMPTLRAYLDEDRVQRRVAARCFIHVNTVVYRIRRIEELLKADLGDPATVFDVTLALRILDLLRVGPPARHALIGLPSEPLPATRTSSAWGRSSP